MSTITLQIAPYIEKLQSEKGYTHQQIADKAEITRATLSRLLNHEARLVHLDTLAALIDFFANEGMEVTPNDLLVVSDG